MSESITDSPTYADGSFQMLIPINWDEPDKVCKVVLKTPNQPDQTQLVDVTTPTVINFPAASSQGPDLDLYGNAPAVAQFPGCPTVSGVGFTNIHIHLPNTNLANLAASGGSPSGTVDYTLTGGTFVGSDCTPQLGSIVYTGVALTLTVNPGGGGTSPSARSIFRFR